MNKFYVGLATAALAVFAYAGPVEFGGGGGTTPLNTYGASGSAYDPAAVAITGGTITGTKLGGLTYPAADGTTNYYLSANGNSNLTFKALPASGGGGDVFTASNNVFTVGTRQTIGTDGNCKYSATAPLKISLNTGITYANNVALEINGPTSTAGYGPGIAWTSTNGYENLRISCNYQGYVDFYNDLYFAFRTGATAIMHMSSSLVETSVPVQIGTGGSPISISSTVATVTNFGVVNAGTTSEITIPFAKGKAGDALALRMPDGVPLGLNFSRSCIILSNLVLRCDNNTDSVITNSTQRTYGGTSFQP